MLNQPVAICGISKFSTGNSYLGNISDDGPAKKYLAEDNIPMHEVLAVDDISRIPSIPLLVYECYLQALHLHRDSLNIKLLDQLALAICKAAPNSYQEVKEYCARVAQANCLEPDLVSVRAEQLRKQLFIHRLKTITDPASNLLSFRLNLLRCSGEEFGIKDVYAASLVAKASLMFQSEYKHWKIRNISGVINKAFETISNAWRFLIARVRL